MKVKVILIFVFFSYLSFGQSPQKFTYQSIIKNSSGYLLKNQDVGLRISILRNSSNGIEVYSEEHFPTSNTNGLVTLIIGEGLTNDNFSDIQWGDGEFFLKVEVDPEGGVNYTMNQTSQLLSVPYALYAGNSGSKLNLLGQDFITLQDQTLTINKVDLADDIDGVLPVVNGGTGSSTAPMVGVITAVDATDARSILGLGTAATTDSSDYATAVQGALADAALQAASVFATAAQGALADTALQASNNLSDITNVVAARTALGIDVSGTDNSTNVSLAGSLDYLTLSGQEITMGQVDYNSDISNTPTLLQLGTTSSTALAGNTTTISSAQSSAITANTAKTTNVTTDLSISGTTGARTIESSDGTDAIIPIATTSVSGLLSPSLFDEIDANTAKLSNSSVSYGGVSVSLGGSDATPAFDLADATNYPTSSLTGSITTSQLADNAVTLAKLARAAANTVLVRDANSLGDPSFKEVTNTQILIGDGTGFTAAALSGDVTMTNAGAVTIANDAVTTVKIRDANVTTDKIANSAVILTTKVAGVLPIANGGTGATNADAANSALNSLGVFTGTGTISSGNGATVTISDSNVTSSSKIFLTFTSDTDGGPYFVDNLSSGSFRVTAATLQGGGTFNYLVINIP